METQRYEPGRLIPRQDWTPFEPHELNRLFARREVLEEMHELALLLYTMIELGSCSPERDGEEIARFMGNYFSKGNYGDETWRNPELSWFADSVGVPLHRILQWFDGGPPVAWHARILDRLIVVVSKSLEQIHSEEYRSRHSFR